MRTPGNSRWRLAAGVLLAAATPVLAHPSDIAPENWWRVWALEPFVAAALFLTAAGYASGLRWLRRATGRPRKLRREAWCFLAGWFALVVALVSPVHPLGQVLFSMHMTQHELLMVVAAPLLVLGRPAIVVAWAFPRGFVRRVLERARVAGARRAWHALGDPFLASLAHALALWIWHAPVLFAATATSDAVHTAQHVSFLGTAVWFWHAVFFGHRREAGFGLGVLYLFFTGMHSGALGALLTFASDVWYAPYAGRATTWGLTALEDQQLGGLIMWVPAGLVYVAAALVLFARWLHAPRRRRPGIAGNLQRPCAPSSSS